MTRRLLQCSAVLAAGAMLSGCIAAAIPIAAGGALAGSEVLEKDDEQAETPAPAISTETLVARIEAEAAAPRDTPEAQAPAAPLDAPAAAALPAADPVASANPYAGLTAFVASAAAMAGDERRSMLLANPASLRPDLTACPPGSAGAVIIDLDPADAPAGASQSALADAAKLIRRQGVTIFWLSGRPESDLVPLRTRLVQSGLDGDAQDSILLLPEGIRKQELRQATGERFCILAIAGDQRADFDELYEHVRDMDRALALESLIGAGWFLVPAPLSEEEIANALGS